MAPTSRSSPRTRTPAAHVLRHSTAHVLAQAVTDLWPGARYAIGPAIEDGFYYDFELPGGAHFHEDDLPRIQARMQEIIAEDQPFTREEHTTAEGLKLFADQPYKQEIIAGVDTSEGAGEGVVNIYRNDGKFLDLCLGPHVPSTGRLRYFQLTKVAAAYWRGDEHRPQLQRIYGTAWESKAALDDYLHRLEEAEKTRPPAAGRRARPVSLPAGDRWRLAGFPSQGRADPQGHGGLFAGKHEKAGYQFVWTPHLAKSTLYETSGHLEWYADSMYPPMEMEGAHITRSP